MSYGHKKPYQYAKQREVDLSAPKGSKGTDFINEMNCVTLRMIECQPFRTRPFHINSYGNCSLYPLLFDQVI